MAKVSQIQLQNLGSPPTDPNLPATDPELQNFRKLVLGGLGVQSEAPAQTLLNNPVYSGSLGKNFNGFIPNIHNREYYGASQQSGMDLLGNAVGQAGSEFVFGAIEAVGYLGDIPGWVEIFKDGEKNFDNFLSEWARENKQTINEDLLPIYDSPFSQGFRPVGKGAGVWWAKNAGTVATGLSFMVPALGVSRTLSAFGKAFGAANKISKTTKIITKGTAAALTSRHMESMMEANQLYDQLIQEGKTSYEAGEAAAKNYKDNIALLATDMIQYISLFGGKGLAKVFSRSATKGSVMKEAILQAPLEALEESYQFISGKEAELVASGDVKPAYLFGENIQERFGDYLRDSEMWTSAWFGAIGGMAIPMTFDGVNRAYDKILGTNKLVQQAIDLKSLDEAGQKDVSQNERNKIFFSTAFGHATQGRMKDYENILEGKIQEFKNDPEQEQVYKKYLEDIPKFEALYNRVMNKSNYSRQGKFEHVPDINRELKIFEISSAWDIRKSGEFLENVKSSENELLSELSESELSGNLKEIKILYQLEKLYSSDQMEGLISNSEERYKEIKKQLEEKIQAHSEDLSKKNLNSLLSTTIDGELSINLIIQEQIVNEINKLKEGLGKVNTAQGQLSILKDINQKRGEQKIEFEEYYSQFVGENVVINKGDQQYDIKTKGDKFIIVKKDNPDIEGAATEDFTDKEYDGFLKTNKISESRLIQIANKKKNDPEGLTKKERTVLERKSQEIGEILSSNQETNEGEGFTRSEIVNWMQGNGFNFLDDQKYKERLEKISNNEKKKGLHEEGIRLAEQLKLKLNTYKQLSNTLTGGQEDVSVVQKMDKLLKQIERINERIKNNNEEKALLEKPRTKKINKPIDVPATKFFESKISDLTTQRESLLSFTELLKEDINQTDALLKQVKKDFRSNKIKPLEYYKKFKALQNSIETNVQKLEDIKNKVDEINQEVTAYNEKLEGISGDNLDRVRNEVSDLLSIHNSTIDSIEQIQNGLEFQLDNLIKSFLSLFNVSKDKVNDSSYIEKTLKKNPSIEDIKTIKKEIKTKNIIQVQFGNQKNKMSSKLRSIKTIQKDLEESPKKSPVKLPKESSKEVESFEDVEPVNEPVPFSPKRRADEAFSFLKGLHYPNNGNVITKYEHQQRYFKFVDSMSMANGEFYIKLVPYSVKGERTPWASLLSTEEGDMRERLGDKFDEVANSIIFAVIVDKNENPIDIDGKPLSGKTSSELLEGGIFTTFPTLKDTPIDRYDGTPEELKIAKENFESSLKNIRENLDVGKSVFLSATSKSAGIPIIEDRKPAILVLKNPNNGELVVSSRGQLQYEGRPVPLKPGSVYLKDNESGQLNQVYSRKLSEVEKETIIQLLTLANEENSFDYIIPEVGRSIRKIIKEYIYYTPETESNIGGYFYEKISSATGKFNGNVSLSKAKQEVSTVINLKELLESKTTLSDWLDEQYHQIRSSQIGAEDRYAQIYWNGESFETTSHKSYYDYLLNSESYVLESTLPAYEDAIDKPQKKSTNIYYDHNNIGIDKIPNKESSTVKRRPGIEPKKSIRQKAKFVGIGKAYPTADEDMLADMKAAMDNDEFSSMDKPAPAQKKEIPKEIGKKIFGKKKGTLDDFLAGKDRPVSLGNYIPENIEEAQEWFKERFPNISFNVVYGLSKSGAWGRFTEHGEVLLDRNAEQGTVYHESFHVVMGLYLSEGEKNGIFNKYRKLRNLENITNNQIEELLAEEFRDFVLTGTMPDFAPKTFFQKLLNFIDWILGVDSIEDIFNNINNGYYAKLTPDFSRVLENKDRSLQDKDARFTKDTIEGVNFLFWREVPEGGLTQKIIDDDIDSEDLKTIYNNVISKIEESIEFYTSELENIPVNHPQYKEIKNIRDGRQWIIDNFYKSEGPTVLDLHKEYLSEFGINIEIPDFSSDEELSTEGSSADNQLAESSLNISAKKTSGNEVKLWLSTIPKVNKRREMISNSLDFWTYEGFSKVFSILQNKLSNSTSIEEISEKIDKLQKLFPAVVEVKNRFFLDTPNNKLSATQVQRKIQFFEAFAKFRNTFSFSFVDKNKEHLHILSNTKGQHKKILSRWESNFKLKILDQTKKVIDSDGILDFTEAVKQISAMGMKIPNIEMIDPKLRTEFSEAVTWISEEVSKGINPFIGIEIKDYDSETNSEIDLIIESNSKGRLKKLLNIAYDLSLDEIENSHLSPDGKPIYDNTLYGYYSLVSTELLKISERVKNEGLSEDEAREILFSSLPQLSSIYTRNSRIIDLVISGKTISSEIISGVKSKNSSIKEFSKLDIYDKFLSVLNNTLAGRYHMIRPSDNKREILHNWGLFMNVEEVNGTKNSISNPVNLLLQYLKDEVEVIKDANISDPGSYNWVFYKENLSLDIYGSDLIGQDEPKLMRSGILISAISSPEVVEILKSYLLGEITVDDFIRHPEIVDKLSSWFSSLLNNKVLPLMGQSKVTDKLLQNYKEFNNQIVGKLFLINYIVGNIEQTKIFTGNPALFKNLDNFLKRGSGLVGTKNLPAIDQDTNDYLRKNFNTKKKGSELTTAVVQDIIVKSVYSDLYIDMLSRRYSDSEAKAKIEKYYDNIIESDAEGLISLEEYREFKFRVGEWNWKQESMYQWEIQEGWNKQKVIVPEDNPYTEIQGKEITKQDVEQDGYFLPVLKPQYSGPVINEKQGVNSLYKLILLPLLPSTVQDKNLQHVSDIMKKNKVGILTFSTGAKYGFKLGDDTGTEGIQPLYKDGEIKQGTFITQDTDYKYWGIQVNNSPVMKQIVSSGTQISKQIESNLISEGVPVDYEGSNWKELSENDKRKNSSIHKKLFELRELNTARQSLGVKNLITELGLKETEIDGEKVFIIDNERFSDFKKTLTKQFIKRGMPSNMIDSIKWINKGIDHMVNREQVENILLSIANSKTVSQKKFGSSSVQVSSSLFELKGKRNYNNGKFSSNDLKFYDVEYKVENKKLSKEEWENQGKPDYDSINISEMEVYLPHYFKELLGGDVSNVNEKLKGLLGFRVPTQALSSIENIRIKGFLPPNGGNYVVVPSEIVAKSGSDFDFDKLFLYFPNYRMEGNVPVYLEFSKSPSKLWNERKKEFTNSLPGLKGEIDKILDNNLENKEDSLDEVYTEAFAVWDKLNIYEKNGKKRIENRTLEIYKELLSDFSRFDELINPNSIDTLKEISNEVNDLKLKNTNPLGYHFIADPTFILEKGLQYQKGKENISRAALTLTSHILFSQTGVYLDLPEGYNIYLNHNSTSGKPSLSSTMTHDGQYFISDLLSEATNGFVDVTNDPFMFSINAGGDGANILLLLLRLGILPRDAILFMNQPIIDEYLNEKQKNNSVYFREMGLSNWDFEKILVEKFTPKNISKSAYRNISSAEKLKSYIEKYHTAERNVRTFTDEERSTQLVILKQFKLYEVLADKMKNAIWGTAYDTSGGGKNIGESMHRLKLTERTIEEGIFKNYENIFKKGEYVYPFYESVKSYLELFKPLMLSLKNPSARSQFEKIIELSIDNFNKSKIISAFKAEFMTYLFQTKQNRDDVSIAVTDKDLIYTYAEDKTRNNTVPKRILEYQNRIEREELPSNPFIEALSVHLEKKDFITGQKIDTLSMNFGSAMGKFDSDIYTQGWEELNIMYPEFSKKLAKFLWIQSGLQNSPINFINLMPNDLYANTINTVLSRVDDTQSFKNFFHEFFFNNMRPSSELWKTIKNKKQIDDSWPAYVRSVQIGPFESVNVYYYNGYVVNQKKVKAINNLKDSSTAKHYTDSPLGDYIFTRKEEVEQKEIIISEENETDKIIKDKDCGLLN